ncbi:MAG: EAL domain-containing protein [Rhodospirillales bacterium]|nr:EAL domain-containing protein [Rhodospirillales bacterium]
MSAAMNSLTSTTARAAGWSGEQLLREYMDHLGEHRAGRLALFVALSRLQPSNRREHHIRAAVEIFSDVIRSHQAEFFSLPNEDFLLFFNEDVRGLMESAAAKICYLFTDDPLINGARQSKRFAQWYSLDVDFDDVVKLIAQLKARCTTAAGAEGGSAAARASVEKRRRSYVLTPEWLDSLQKNLAQTDISNFIRRHRVCQIIADEPIRTLFGELTVSVADLASTVLPGVDLRSDPWLFQYLTETFDRRMLALLAKPDVQQSTSRISINLNISTLLSDEFLSFERNLFAARRGTIVIELKAIDIFDDLEAYLLASRFARSRGYEISIDGLTHRTMGLLDREKLNADFLKVDFTGDLFEGREMALERLAAVARRHGLDRFILARIETRQALSFGQQAGVRLFQGHYVESAISNEQQGRFARPHQSRSRR